MTDLVSKSHIYQYNKKKCNLLWFSFNFEYCLVATYTEDTKFNMLCVTGVYWMSPASRGKTNIISNAWIYHWRRHRYKVPWCQHPGQHEMGHPYQHRYQQSQQNTWLPPAQTQDRQQEDEGNSEQSPCSTDTWVCSHSLGSLHWKWDQLHRESQTQSGKMGLKPTPPNIVRQFHQGLSGMAISSITPPKARLDMFFKLHHDLVSISSSYLPRPTSGRCGSRKNNDYSYDIPSCRTQNRQMSFFPRAIPDWNSLPQEIVAADTLDCFKSRLNSHLKQWPSPLPPPPPCLPTAEPLKLSLLLPLFIYLFIYLFIAW